jgi:CheY-like chemotaxis protein
MTDIPMSVLLVDDDKFLLDMYAMKFTKEGFTVQSSLSVHDALSRLKQGFKPDAVVFDLVMPEIDGMTFLQILKRENLSNEFLKIALTNQASDMEQAQAKELGADMFITKATMIPSEVVNMVRDAISRKKPA